MDARDQFFAVEGFGQIIVGAKAEALDLVFGIVGPGQDQDRRFDPRQAQLAQNLMPAHVGQVQVQQDQVVVVKLGQIDPVFAQVGAIDVQIGMGQHQFDAARGRRVVFNQQNAHLLAPSRIRCSLTTLAAQWLTDRYSARTATQKQLKVVCISGLS